jgi:hypothetical protein
MISLGFVHGILTRFFMIMSNLEAVDVKNGRWKGFEKPSIMLVSLILAIWDDCLTLGRTE